MTASLQAAAIFDTAEIDGIQKRRGEAASMRKRRRGATAAKIVCSALCVAIIVPQNCAVLGLLHRVDVPAAAEPHKVRVLHCMHANACADSARG